MAKSVVEVLTEARKLIEKPEHWTQGVSARSRTGRHVSNRSKRAVCWCASGALDRVSYRINAWTWLEASNALRGYMRGHIEHFNDTRTHADVLKAFDRAIARASEAA